MSSSTPWPREALLGERPADAVEFTLRSIGRSWSFLRPADPDAVLDSMTDEEYARDQFLPYWAELWPSTEALLEKLAAILPRQRATVCDLGCGLGVVGAILAALGHTVTAVDIAPAACRYAAANLRRGAAHAAFHVVCADWRYSCLRTRFDLIVAADILYEPRWVEPVIEFLRDHLTDTGRACIADPRRASWDQFITRAARDDFSTSRLPAHDGKVEIGLLHRTQPPVHIVNPHRQIPASRQEPPS